MAGFSSLANKAREIFSKRGGSEAAKEDLQELKDIHARGGSMSDKAKAAVDALKEPGMKGPDRSAPPGEEPRVKGPDRSAPPGEEPRAPEHRSGPERR
jgi:hypothetical protein